MKKILSLLLAMVMMFSMTTFASATTLKDIDNHMNTEAIEVLNDLGIIYGYGDNTYRPDNNITRGEVCAIVTRALVGDDACAIRYPDRFKDVSNTSKLRKYVDTAYNMGIMRGYGNGYFGLTDNVTYNQMAAIITRALGYSADNMVGNWPDNVNSVALELGLFKNVAGYGAAYATRGDVAQMMFNAFSANMVKSIGYGLFKPTNTLFIEYIGFSFDESVMTMNDRATFGNEVMVYSKDNKTVVTDYNVTDRVNAIVETVGGNNIVVKYGKTYETIQDQDTVKYYKNGVVTTLANFEAENDIVLIYKDSKLVRMVQWVAADPIVGDLSVKDFEDTYTEIIGDKYIPGVSVITTYGDFAVEVSNTCVEGRIADISTVGNTNDKKVTLKNGNSYVIPEELLTPEVVANLNVNAFIEITFDYYGEMFSVTTVNA